MERPKTCSSFPKPSHHIAPAPFPTISAYHQDYSSFIFKRHLMHEKQISHSRYIFHKHRVELLIFFSIFFPQVERGWARDPRGGSREHRHRGQTVVSSPSQQQQDGMQSSRPKGQPCELRCAEAGFSDRPGLTSKH